MVRLSVNAPEDREYTRSHEWIRLDGENAVVGITAVDTENFAESTCVELPQEGSAVKAGDIVAAVVFGNAKRTVRAPLSGSIAAINLDLKSHPELVKRDPYGAGWLFRLKIEAGEELEHLLDCAAYREQLRAAEATEIEVP